LSDGQAADRSLRALLDEIAATTPAPGGGSSSAWACAIAAGLVEMAAGFPRDGADAHARTSEIADRARQLRALALELAEAELHAYAPVLAALKLPKTDPTRAARLDAALSEAAETPLAIARVGSETALLAHEASRLGSRHLTGDALTALFLAEGATQAAARLVEINLSQRPSDDRLAELARLTGDAAAARSAAR
jgi:methenyltetrahydrofolate cyclohydrolase